MIKPTVVLTGLIFAILFSSCQNEKKDTTAKLSKTIDPPASISFTQIDPEVSTVNFNNQLDIEVLKSSFDYINVFNGGGVAIGDINNDNLPDLYFTGNLSDNKLYLNKGDFKFEDITTSAGVAGAEGWSTGVTMADVNQDGRLDIYVSRSYYDPSEQFTSKNLLYINKGNNKFEEEAEQYGVADAGYTIQSSFIDYDRDGDLDLFVANHPRYLGAGDDVHYQGFVKPTMQHSDHLYRNEGNGKFSDVTSEAGILNYGWSLGISTADVNGDGWSDIYVAVDHDLPDKLYINQKDGTFRNEIKSSMAHISLSSMGVDIADINNDQQNDVFVVDMLAQDNYRQKTQMADMNPRKAAFLVERGYHIQTMRNMLQLNTGQEQFSEIGQMAKLSKTDWSWAALLVDLDNDGWKDLFVSNGYYKNLLDKDRSKELIKKGEIGQQKGESMMDIYLEHVRDLASSEIPNTCFQNNQKLIFDDISASSGLDFQGISTGAAYADLDNDGDLDMVVNNIDAPAGIFSNQSREKGGYNYISVRLNAPQILGAVVSVNNGATIQSQEVLATRGYQSAVDTELLFGIGSAEEVSELTVTWPDGTLSKELNLKANTHIEIDQSNAKKQKEQQKRETPLFQSLEREKGIAFRHREKKYDDYKKQVLLPHKLSQLGPSIAVADINGDDKEDIFIGGGNGQSGEVYVQQAEGTFEKIKNSIFAKDKASDDIGAAFGDYNGDGHADLYVASGGYEYDENSANYRDRLYLGDGKGDFVKNTEMIPDIKSSNSCVKPMDYDQDGDIDLFIGGRLIPGKYPLAADSYLLENVDGKLKPNEELIALKELGMVTDAKWVDLNKDNKIDLMIVGEWMSPKVYIQDENGFTDRSEEYLGKEQVGWWNSIEVEDINGDDIPDIVLGNLGKNYKYTATDEAPFHVYAGDLDENGSSDIILGYFNDDVLYPLRGKQCSSEQLPMLNEKFKTYDAFAKASIRDVYGDKLDEAYHLIANKFESIVLLSNSSGRYTSVDLPNMAQLSPINAILIDDYNLDGHKDILVGGNLFVSEVETGRADAGQGVLLYGDSQGHFTVASDQTGLYLKGDVKDMASINTAKGKYLIVANNDAYIDQYLLTRK